MYITDVDAQPPESFALTDTSRGDYLAYPIQQNQQQTHLIVYR